MYVLADLVILLLQSEVKLSYFVGEKDIVKRNLGLLCGRFDRVTEQKFLRTQILVPHSKPHTVP